MIVGRDIVLDDSSSTFVVLPGTQGTVRVDVGGEDILSVSLTYQDTDFVVEDLGASQYATDVVFGSSDSTLTVSVDYEDGETITEVYSVEPTSYGLVYEEIDEERDPVAGGILIVYDVESGDKTQWSGSRYLQENPKITTDSGAAAWYVPNGTYIVTFGKSDYEDTEVRVRVRDNVLNPSLLAIRIEDDLAIVDEPVDDVEEPVVVATVTDVTQAVSDTVTAVADAVSETLDAVREVPEVQAVATVAQPVIVASAIGGTVVLASSFSLLPFLQYLFTAPLLFFARRRRQQFGLIYNAFTKVPVDLAIVRLYSEAGKLVKTMVTDQEGRYFFQADPGHYKIEVVKDGFVFPSETLKGQTQDGSFLDLYTGGLIEVTDKTAIISANIPVEPIQAPQKVTPRKIYLMRFLRIFQRLIGFSGAVLALFVWLIQPSALSVSVLIFQVLVLGVTMYLIRPKLKKGWGMVFEKISGGSIRNAIVRLYEPKYNKLLETTITDGKGRYAFLAGQNEYYVTYEKGGYLKHKVGPVDFTKNEKPTFITVDVAMQKAR